MALKDPIVGDYVESYTTRVIGKVTVVNDYWGWFKVKFLNGKTSEFRIHNSGTQVLRRVSKEELADHFLKLENSGVTDYWNE
jgi:hypothetical protein